MPTTKIIRRATLYSRVWNRIEIDRSSRPTARDHNLSHRSGPTKAIDHRKTGFRIPYLRATARRSALRDRDPGATRAFRAALLRQSAAQSNRPIRPCRASRRDSAGRGGRRDRGGPHPVQGTQLLRRRRYHGIRPGRHGARLGRGRPGHLSLRQAHPGRHPRHSRETGNDRRKMRVSPGAGRPPHWHRAICAGSPARSAERGSRRRTAPPASWERRSRK